MPAETLQRIRLAGENCMLALCALSLDNDQTLRKGTDTARLGWPQVLPEDEAKQRIKSPPFQA